MIAVACVGIAGAVMIPVLTYARMKRAEHAARDTLIAVGEAQRVFRRAGGRGGYATDFASLTTPCPGESQPVLTENVRSPGNGYVFVLRAARESRTASTDCHGRTTATDFYAAARPADETAGRQAFALTAWGRVYAFFDGIAPLETDMATGGLAVPADALDTFKIP